MRKSLWIILILLLVAITAPCAQAGSVTVTFTCTGDNTDGFPFGPCLVSPAPTTPDVTFQGPTLEITWYTAANPSPIAVTLPSTWLVTDSFSWFASNDMFFIFDHSIPGSVVGVADTNLPDGNGLSEFGTLTFTPGTGGTGSSVTPEPGTLLLLGSGLMGIGFLRRKLWV